MTEQEIKRALLDEFKKQYREKIPRKIKFLIEQINNAKEEDLLLTPPFDIYMEEYEKPYAYSVYTNNEYLSDYLEEEGIYKANVRWTFIDDSFTKDMDKDTKSLYNSIHSITDKGIYVQSLSDSEVAEKIKNKYRSEHAISLYNGNKSVKVVLNRCKNISITSLAPLLSGIAEHTKEKVCTVVGVLAPIKDSQGEIYYVLLGSYVMQRYKRRGLCLCTDLKVCKYAYGAMTCYQIRNANFKKVLHFIAKKKLFGWKFERSELF